jgi:hypothetical protein
MPPTLVDTLLTAGWTVRLSPTPLLLPEHILQRHPRVPADWLNFVTHVASATHPDETAWFLTVGNYAGTDPTCAFEWDFAERLSREAAGSDATFLNNIHYFWSTHLPILFSVKNGYAHVSLDLRPETFGRVVEGNEPEFEETSALTRSFTELVEQLARPAGEVGTRLALLV